MEYCTICGTPNYRCQTEEFWKGFHAQVVFDNHIITGLVYEGATLQVIREVADRARVAQALTLERD